MTDDSLYAAAGGESNKRKYDESPSPIARRATGFSSTPDSAAPPPSFNSVPSPMNEIELAKQKAQEIAARLLNTADPTKRARVETLGTGGRGGFDSSDYSSQKPSGYGYGGPPPVQSSGYPGPSRRIEIPNGRVGVIIGRGGETIKYLQLQSGAKIQVTRDADVDPNSTTRGVDLTGTPDQIAKAEQLIQDVLSEAEAGGPASMRLGGQASGAEQFVMKVPNNKVGLVIGKGGETIKGMQARTGARVQVIPLHLPPGDTSQERTVQIDGTSEQIEAAKQIIYEVTSENRNRNSSMSGGYPQQGYQARPPSWGQSGPPMQQPGYSYPQPGAYPGAPPQYNTNQPPYSGYPPQSASSGYAAGWDQSTAAQTQTPQGAASYDYYNQQQQPQQQQPAPGAPGAPADASGYGYGSYGQAPAYSQGQGYGQYGYSGYSQPQQNPGAGYDSQQQGYNASNSTPDTQTASYGTQEEANQAPISGQSYNAGGQPVANPNYPPTQPGYGKGGYGPPGAQKPPSGQAAYAQPQQSPSSVGAGNAQPGYPQSHYGQTATYPASQPGYGAPPYAAAPPSAAQPGYGQQQPAAYNSSYAGGGYSQAPAYPSDGSAGGDARATYDATPPPQAAPNGSAKSSPPS